MAANLVYKEESEHAELPTIINLDAIDKILTHIKLIQFNISRAEEERQAFLKTNDMKDEAAKKNTIASFTSEISAKISATSKSIAALQAECNARASELQTDVFSNAELRMQHTAAAVMQARLYELIKASSRLQLDVKNSYQDKVKRQLAVHAPNANEEQMEQLMAKPEVS